jgi:putative colanic acid biosynthesis acetyltransferase WcaF
MTAMGLVKLKDYDNAWYAPGGSFVKRALWMVLGQSVLGAGWLPGSGLRVWLLRAFGARVGQGVVIKPGVKVKYPWHLELGNHCWIGEDSWIDNLTTVRIGENAVVSQGAYLCTGNHDWSDPHFGLRVQPIELGEGAWAGARCVLTPGTVLGAYAVAAAGAVVKGSIPAQEIYAGNPAHYVKTRSIRSANEVREASTYGVQGEVVHP